MTDDEANYYVAWVPPNKQFDEKVCNHTTCDSLAKAQQIASDLNNATTGNLGTYETRQWVITPR